MVRGIGYIKWVERDSGNFTVTTYDNLDKMCFDMAHFYAWSDCDDSFDLVEAFWDGAQVRYAGWLPQMQFDFYREGELVWRNWFPQWDH